MEVVHMKNAELVVQVVLIRQQTSSPKVLNTSFLFTFFKLFLFTQTEKKEGKGTQDERKKTLPTALKFTA